MPVLDYTSLTRYFLKLAPDFKSFAAAACSRFVFSLSSAKLYWFDSIVPDRAQSHKLDSSSYAEFVTRCFQGDLRAVYVYSPTSTDPLSPSNAPCELGRAEVRLCDVSEFDEDAADSSRVLGNSRSSSQQSHFNRLVLRRDSCCVVCGSINPDLLEAAHILPRDCEDRLAVQFGLPSSWVVENGIALCKPCHRLYDAHLFYIHNNTVVVADGLRQDASLGGTLNARHGQPIFLPSEVVDGDRLGRKYWPAEQTFAFAREGFDEARARRHVDDESTYRCDEPSCSYSAKVECYIRRHKL